VTTVPDLEDALRRVLADPARELPPWPDAVERVRTGMRRRYARRLLARISIGFGVALATTAAALTPSLLAQDQPQPPPGRSVIPFVDLPPVDPPAPVLQTRPILDPCRPADLEDWNVEVGGALGRQIYEARAKLRTDAAACTLTGSPGLAGLLGGKVKAIAATPTDPTDPPDPHIVAGSMPATLEPGEGVAVTFDTHSGCLDGRPETVYTSVRLLFGGYDVVLTGTDINATCGVGIGRWYRVAPEPVDRTADLQSTITAPATARLGADLDFVVTLSNPTGEPIALDPCPSYLATVGIELKNGIVRRLNCVDPTGRTRVIPAGGSLTFAIRLSLPAPEPGLSSTVTGPTTLDWILADGPTTRTEITVVAS
jgi:hypothetical protein